MKQIDLMLVMLMIVLAGCMGIGPKNSDSYGKYISALQEAELHKTAMAQKWIDAGVRAMNDSIIVELPFAETGFFQAGNPDARGYRFEVQAGQVLTVDVATRTEPDGRLFVSLFRWEPTGWQSIYDADSATAFQRSFDEYTICLLRLQPELMVDLYYSLHLTLTPDLINPLSGSGHQEGTVYGSAAYPNVLAGTGIRIAVSKGTPVRAPTDGTVVQTDMFSGNAFVRILDRNGNLYYFSNLEHLEVRPGNFVIRGDTIGYVSAVGVKKGKPYLYYRIYPREVNDALKDVVRMSPEGFDSLTDSTYSRMPHRVVSSTATMRNGPGASGLVKEQLLGGMYLDVAGQSGSWYYSILPDGTRGYVHQDDIERTLRSTMVNLSSAAFLKTLPSDNGIPVRLLEPSASVFALAWYDQFTLLEASQGIRGWVEDASIVFPEGVEQLR